MARPGVTYLDVSNAAQQLVAAGRTPTIESIRIALGTGSNSTLGVHLKTWKSKQDQTQQIATKENIPEELISALKGVWERVMNQSEDRIQTIHQETQQELLQLRQEVQRLQRDNARWQQQHQQTKQERDSIANERLAIEKLLSDTKVEIAALVEKHAGIEQQNHQKQERIDELRQQNQQIQANLEHYRNASLEQRMTDQQRYEQQLKQLEQTIQKSNQELKKVQHDKLMLQQESQRLMFENEGLQRQHNKIIADHESINSKLTDTLSELSKTTQDQQHWQKACKTIEGKWDEQNQSFIDLKTQHATLLQQSEALRAEVKDLRDQNKLLAHEKWELGQEKAQIYGQLKQLDRQLN
jgi:chromosome segregation ATPase